MNLSDICQRNLAPQPWEEGEKIPWNDTEFSKRMLREHLSQKHDAASRRIRVINKHVAWIQAHVLGGMPSSILDLGCGPGLYASRLVEHGHTCHGIDFSPASIEYAIKNRHERCTYTLGDIRSVEYGGGYDLVMLIYGEFNVFTPQDAQSILHKSFNALKQGGQMLLEIQTFDAVHQMGNQPATWYSAEDELFDDQPHLCLMESFWEEENQVAIERYYIVNAFNGEVLRYASTTQAYDEKALGGMLGETGFTRITTYPSLTGKYSSQASPMVVLLAQK